jgi:hypothetical protein
MAVPYNSKASFYYPYYPPGGGYGGAINPSLWLIKPGQGPPPYSLEYGGCPALTTTPIFLMAVCFYGSAINMQSIEDLCRRAACKLSPAKFKGATHFLIKYG